jgi:hypothetical protein
MATKHQTTSSALYGHIHKSQTIFVKLTPASKGLRNVDSDTNAAFSGVNIDFWRQHQSWVPGV